MPETLADESAITPRRSSMRPLFAIGDDLAAIYDLVDETGGELTPDLEAWLAEIEHDEAAKCDAYVHLIKTAEMEAAAAKAEAEQWLARAAARTNFSKRLKERMKLYMEASGRTKIATATGRTLAIQANGGKVPMVLHTDDTSLLPKEFTRVIVTPDNEKIREALESGAPLAFAHLEERGSHLRIR